jgi:hypothetical protein
VPSDASTLIVGVGAKPAFEEHARTARVDRAPEVGLCSTRPSPGSWTDEAGLDTLKLLWWTRDFGDARFELEGAEGWKFGSIPALSLTWAEGHPAVDGLLAGGLEVAKSASMLRDLVDERFGVIADRGVSRSDQTVTTKFERPKEARAFLTGMAAVQLPRTETTRRGHPVHSISWTAPNGRRILARCYDQGRERGGESFVRARREDQRRYSSNGRPPVEVVADGDYMRGRFDARFGPVRKAVDGVKAATFPVVARALADEARYGYRSVREVERLAGALVILSGGAGEAYKRSTFFNRRAELRDAGYVVVDDVVEAVEVDLGEVVEQALAAEWSYV